MGCLRVYVREAEGKPYPEELACSVHFASSRDGLAFEPLNRNYGILFAPALENDDGTLSPMELSDPLVFPCEAGFAIVARRLGKGLLPDPASSGKLLLWTSRDLVDFDFRGLKTTAEIEGYPERASNEIELSDEVFHSVKAAWSPYPVPVSEAGGGYPFPLARGCADPVLFRWEGAWHFISTNDLNGNIGFRVRRAMRVPELFEPGAAEYLILDRDEEKGLVQTFWAPEFHVIGGRLYLLFAVSGKEWGPQCRMMRLRPGGRVVKAEDWEEPLPVTSAAGGPLAPGGITLDMTHLRAGGRSYLVWSRRFGIGTPKDSGSMLCIARIDPDAPWRLAGEPVLLSRPLQGWENQSGTVNNEGPFPLYHEGMVHLAFSGGDARGFAYSIGFLSAREDADLLDPRAWKKSLTPALHSYCLEGQYGPGHNSFFEDDEGRTWIAYHAEEFPDRSSACTAIRRVFFDASGRPRLDYAITG